MDASLRKARRSLGWLEPARQRAPGLALCVVFALAATFVSEHQGGPQLLYALLFGMAFHGLAESPVLAPGIELAAKTLLRCGVAFLGARISLAQVGALGWSTVALVCLATVLTIGLGVLGARLLGRGHRELGLLTGGAVAICGASAAMALAAALPRHPDNERYALLTVVGVTSLSTLAMIVYPLLCQALGLDAHTSGIFLGATIHDVAQAVGAAATLGHPATDMATIVKLLRVALLAPVVMVVSLCYARSATQQEGPLRRWLPVPGFLLGFMALVVLNSLGWLAPQATAGLGTSSRWLLVVAITALGMRTSLQRLQAIGWRPVALMLGETLFLLVFILAALKWLPHSAL